MDGETNRMRGEALGKLLAELERLEGVGGEIRPEELAGALGLSVGDVEGVLAGRAAMGELLAPDLGGELGEVGGISGLPLPVMPEGLELMEELGRGGMGVVYRARQVSLDREVAVKVMRPAEILFAESMKRFGRETRALAKLRHPHIAAIHEVGESAGNLYFTMELIEGGTLAKYMDGRKRPVPLAFGVRVLRQVGGALAFVHGHGLVHRDLKPANILLDKEDNAHVVDFGLALDPAAHATLTATGRLMGTPAYMAPEQAKGERALVTERTDIYGLGVLLYELVCGVPPFKGGSIVDTVRAVVQDEPERPRKLRPDLPPALENVILKAMAKDPSQRYGTAAAMVRDLERFESGEDVEARAPSMARSWARHVRRFRVPYAAALGGLVVSVLLAVNGRLGGGIDGTPGARLAVIEELEAAGAEGAAAALSRSTLKDLEGSGALDEASRELYFRGLCAEMAEWDKAASWPSAGPASEKAREELRSMLGRVAEFGERGGESVRCALFRLGIEERLGDPVRPWLHQGEATSVKAALDGMFDLEHRFGEHPDISRQRVVERVFLPVLLSEAHPLRGPAAATYWAAETSRMVIVLPDTRVLGQSFLAGALPLIVRRVSDPVRIGHRLRSWFEDSSRYSSVVTESRHRIDEGPLVQLVLDETLPDGRRFAAMDCLCTVLELPQIELRPPLSESRAADQEVTHAGAIVRTLEPRIFDPVVLGPLLDAIASGSKARRAERLWIEAEGLIRSLAIAGEHGHKVTRHGVNSWFKDRMGIVLPRHASEMTGWWDKIKGYGALRYLAHAVGFDAGKLDDPDVDAMLFDALLEKTDSSRMRIYHELLVATAADEGGLPSWLWSERPSMMPRGHKVHWRRALGRELAVQNWRVELALLRSRTGLEKPELLWTGTQTMDGDSAVFASGPLRVDATYRFHWRRWNAWKFRSSELSGFPLFSKEMIPPDTLPAGTMGLWVGLQEAYLEGHTGLAATTDLLQRASARYQLGRLGRSGFRERLLVGPNEVRVLSDWISTDNTVVQDRFTLLIRTAAVEPQLDQSEISDGKAWTLALFASLAEGLRNPPATPRPEGAYPKQYRAPTVSPMDVQVAARWMVDYGGELDDAARKVAGALKSLEPGTMMASKFDFHSVSCGFRALLSPGTVTKSELSNWAQGSTSPTVLSNPERGLLSDNAGLRALAMDSMSRRTESLTHDEARAVRERLTANGEALSSLPSQYQAERNRDFWRAEPGGWWFPATLILLLGAAARRSGRGFWITSVLGVAWVFMSVQLSVSSGISGNDALLAAVGWRWATVARGEDRFPVFGVLIVLYLGARWATQSLADPAVGHSLALGALFAAFTWHAVRGVVLSRRGRGLDGASVAWVCAVTVLWNLVPWALLATGLRGANSQWADDVAAPAALSGLFPLLLLMMLVPGSFGLASWWDPHRGRRKRLASKGGLGSTV